jgi:D-threo-aldose 1-dehydrogenase
MGHVLRALPDSDYVISTKVGRYMVPDDDLVQTRPGLAMRGEIDYSKEATLRSLDQSLQRLGVGRLDIVLIHDVDLRTHKTPKMYERRFGEAMSGAYEVLHAAREEGTIGAIGIGVNEVQPCLDFAAAGGFDCMMLAGRYTLLDHRTALAALLPECQRRGIAVLVAGAYNSGILASGAVAGATYDYAPASPEMLSRVQAIETICTEFEVPIAAAALQFPTFHPAVASVVVGAANAAEVERNLDLISRTIPTAFWTRLKEAGVLSTDAPVA